jgi:hypothetical protein
MGRDRPFLQRAAPFAARGKLAPGRQAHAGATEAVLSGTQSAPERSALLAALDSGMRPYGAWGWITNASYSTVSRSSRVPAHDTVTSGLTTRRACAARVSGIPSVAKPRTMGEFETSQGPAETESTTRGWRRSRFTPQLCTPTIVHAFAHGVVHAQFYHGWNARSEPVSTGGVRAWVLPAIPVGF